jgi:hypothetical protein
VSLWQEYAGILTDGAPKSHYSFRNTECSLGAGGQRWPWGHHPPRHYIPFGVHTLDIGSVILDLEQPRGGRLLWSDPELLPRIGPARALLLLEHVHGLADCW